MLDKYELLQPVFYKFITSSFNNDKISHAYLIETGNVKYGTTLAIDMAKFLLCNGVFDEKICHLIDSDSYSDFKIVDCEKMIKKDDILNLKTDFSMKSSSGRMVYLINDASKLNSSSSNSLLKFLEEPEDGIVAILLVDNVGKVLETISSRCQIINLVDSEEFDYKSIFSYYNVDNDGDYDEFILRETNLFFDFYKNLETSGAKVLVNFDCYSLTNRMKPLLLFGLYLYMDVLNDVFDLNKKYISNINFNDFAKKGDINDIIKKIDVIDEFLYKVSFNVNLNLFMDNFVLSMKGV